MLEGDWADAAACKGYPTGMFYPERGDSAGLAAAKAVCADCPLTEPCLDEALSFPPGRDLHGIFGGLSPRARREERKRRGIKWRPRAVPVATPVAVAARHRPGQRAVPRTARPGSDWLEVALGR